MKSRLKSPNLTLKNYGGYELNILKEVTVKLERRGYLCIAVIFLQKNPLHDLLIGTDLLPSLGFQFIKKTSNLDGAEDIFTNKKCNVGGQKEKSVVEKPPMQDVESSFQVKLISAVRVSAQHEKLIKDEHFAKDSGITMDEPIIKPSNENNITLVLWNNGFHPVCLEEGRVLGILQEATFLCLEEDIPWMDKKTPTVVQALHTSKETSSPGEHNQALLETLLWQRMRAQN